MHTLLLLVVTSGLVLLQTNQGLTANLDPDADFLDEATADGFIVGTTKGSTKTEKPQDNYNSIVTHDSLNPEANLSIIQKDSLPTATGAKFPEASTELTTENTHELPRNISSAASITVDSSKTTTLSSEENAEGSGFFPEWDSKTHTSMIHTTFEAVAEVDSSDGSGIFSDTLDKNQSQDLLFPTSVRISEDLDTSTHVYNSLEDNSESGMGSEAPSTDWMMNTSSSFVEKDVKAGKVNNEVQAETRIDEPIEKASQPKLSHINQPVNIPEPTKYAGTPDWLLILALCLTVVAVVCVLIGIATKDMWYGPCKRSLNVNAAESKEYDRAATLPLSEKEKMALMSAAKEATKETDCTISIEEFPEKKYLM